MLEKLRARWRVLSGSRRLEADMRDEMRFHIEMEADRLVREHGLDPQEARRQAHVRFGGVEKYKEAGRDARGRQWLDALALDARLGVRMLVKHRGLTLIGGFAMAVAIAIGATFYELVTEVINPTLPLPDGDRVVALQYATDTPGSPERRVLHDFVEWRQQLVSIEQLGAFRTTQHNLLSTGAPPEPITIAEITASAFAIAQTPPLLGRYLLPADEGIGATPVVVLGYQAWQSRFDRNPQIVGRMINLGGVQHVVIGVMPNGFTFPIDHQFWIPLQLDPLEFPRLQGPQLRMFGRLAPGATMQQAQAELSTIGQRAAAAHPDTHARLRPVVIRYAHEHLGVTDPFRLWGLRAVALLVGMLSFVVAVNLAILIYARTVTRLGEIAVRTALGASRRRILAQLFIEALALSVVGAAGGLVLADVAIDRLRSLIQASGGTIPFWTDFNLSFGAALYAFALAVLAAVIMGVLPGLRATGRRLSLNLHELNGRTGTRLGPMWTTLVVAQIAVAVAVLPMAVYVSWQVVQMEIAESGFAANEFVVGTVAITNEASTVDATRLQAKQLALMARLEMEPGVSRVTFSSGVPGFAPGGGRIQFSPSTSLRASPSTSLGTSASTMGGTMLDEARFLYVTKLDVALDMFEVYDAEIVAGRTFNSGDLGAASAAVVNETFVKRFLEPTDDVVDATPMHSRALGLVFRYASADSRLSDWHQIVGVVRDFPSFPPTPDSEGEPTVYHPAAPGDVHPLVLSVRFNGHIPDGVRERYRQLAADVDPALQLRDVVPLASFYNDVRAFWRYLAWGIGLVTMSVLLLSAAGIYAMLSFAVAQRTREIGIRIALGAAPHRLLMNIFGRVSRQIALGIVIGSLPSGALLATAGFTRAITLGLAVAALMTLIGLLAAIGPARRSLRLQPYDALRIDQ